MKSFTISPLFSYASTDSIFILISYDKMMCRCLFCFEQTQSYSKENCCCWPEVIGLECNPYLFSVISIMFPVLFKSLPHTFTHSYMFTYRFSCISSGFNILKKVNLNQPNGFYLCQKQKMHMLFYYKYCQSTSPLEGSVIAKQPQIKYCELANPNHLFNICYIQDTMLVGKALWRQRCKRKAYFCHLAVNNTSGGTPRGCSMKSRQWG